ncbi:uncharacterized protein LOC131245486 isoform X2 [Magnolia sinica]|nr:uncharacterized protein LOC131245486 isoform X2 [Magnolia sinica]XP_058100971.1 uncharacterized protein LOC131245486 isoform X2 [Magnolia sinica]
METAVVENSHSSTSPSSDADHHPENSVPDLLDDGDMEPKLEVTEEEAISIMEVIAATGKFWHDWDMLKCLLSSRLKQVLAEYPEAQMVNDMIGPQQSSLSGEIYPEVVKRLDEALLSFVEGPPFTLQRLCEILLTAQSVYPNLSKLALALEKNLLVTSTLTVCTDPYPLTTIKTALELDKGSEEPQAHPNPTQNGLLAIVGNGDEEMVDAEVDEDDKIHEDSNKTEDDKIHEDSNKTEVDGDDKIHEDSNTTVEMETAEVPTSEVSKPSTEPAALPELSGNTSQSSEHAAFPDALGDLSPSSEHAAFPEPSGDPSASSKHSHPTA